MFKFPLLCALDERLIKFYIRQTASGGGEEARARSDEKRDILEEYANGRMSYEEFVAGVRGESIRRNRGLGAKKC